MAKQRKTISQLEALVRDEMGDAPISHLEIRKDPAYGWSAFVIALPRVVGKYQMLADIIVQKLRGEFDLEP